MTKIDSSNSEIKLINKIVDDALYFFWFHHLIPFDLVDADSEMKTSITKLIFNVDGEQKNLLYDSALSHYINAKVCYFWGKENKDCFDVIQEKCSIYAQNDIYGIQFSYNGESYIFVCCDEFANVKFARKACELTQHKWDDSQSDPELFMLDEKGRLFSNTIEFLFEQLYSIYDHKDDEGDI
jgi:hypothetical protein